jgi:hypothetical protein
MSGSLITCRISGNSTAGSYGGVFLGSGIIIGCLISNDTTAHYSGLYCPNSDTILNNTIINNIDTAVTGNTMAAAIGGRGNVTPPFVSNNNVYNNTSTYFIENINAQATPNVNIANNYWGITDVNLMRSKIYDWFVDNTRSIVDFQPMLSAPDPNCPAAAWLPLP